MPSHPAKNEIVVYQPDETLRLDVRVENETVWLTQTLIGELFGVDRTTVVRHIRNIYQSGELVESATCAKNAQVQLEGGRSGEEKCCQCDSVASFQFHFPMKEAS